MKKDGETLIEKQALYDAERELLRMVDRDPARLVDVTPHRLDALGVDSYAAGEVCARQVSQLLNNVPTDVPRVAVAAMTWMDGFAVGVIAAKKAP